MRTHRPAAAPTYYLGRDADTWRAALDRTHAHDVTPTRSIRSPQQTGDSSVPPRQVKGPT